MFSRISFLIFLCQSSSHIIPQCSSRIIPAYLVPTNTPRPLHISSPSCCLLCFCFLTNHKLLVERRHMRGKSARLLILFHRRDGDTGYESVCLMAKRLKG
ncbi:hypothetical protein K402DRAFT_227060 [Aulographum hederae CBS 113979]|uniref:Secreted protein n=1 Tax=Aulographum hederae CBS 113979 TaxID=1176131 RepID=A0A6G1HAY9_9PEZI|nr:hypothetical protein K402DRAFT_227060 [Aulographum hederae CBS 113979]